MLNSILDKQTWLYILQDYWYLLVAALLIWGLSHTNIIKNDFKWVPRLISIMALAAFIVLLGAVQLCSNCDKITHKDDVYCRGCGNQVYFDTGLLEKYDTLEQCNKCLKYYTKGDNYCAVCGAATALSKNKLERVQCEGCRRYTEFVNNYCPHCGKEVIHNTEEEAKELNPLEEIAKETNYKTPLIK